MKPEILEVGLRVGKAALHLGFVEATIQVGDVIRLIRPFTAQGIHSGPGIVMCRGHWGHPHLMKAAECVLTTSPAEPWMALEACDLIRVYDFLSTLEIECSEDGFKRGFSL